MNEYSLYEAGLIPRNYFLEVLGYSGAQRAVLQADLHLHEEEERRVRFAL